MRAPVVVAVDRGPEAFQSLFAAAREAGERFGWLELATDAASPVPPDLASAAESGALRAVRSGGGRTIVVKPVAGPAVLRDLVREHFLGCTLILVRGWEGWPRVEPSAGGYELRSAVGRSRSFGAAELVAELRRPKHRAGKGRP